MKKRKKRKLHPNPAWVDAVMISVWDELQSTVGSKALPVPYESGDDLPVTFREYGCGSWGCVYPTSTDGLVVKVTSDESEAAFIQDAINEAKRYGFPEGMVRYYMVAKVSGAKRLSPRGDEYNSIYVIWREGVDHVGEEAIDMARRDYGFKHVDQCMDLLKIALWSSRYVNSLMKMDDLRIDFYTVDELTEQKLDEVASNDAFDVKIEGIYEFERAREEESAEDAVALAVANYKRAVAGLRGSGKPFSVIGSAMMYYLDKGVLLEDVRGDNLGLVFRPSRGETLVITDPGMTLYLGDASRSYIKSTKDLEQSDWLANPKVIVG